MEGLYGPVTAFMISVVVTGLTQAIKQYTTWAEGDKPKWIALALSLALSGTFHILGTLVQTTEQLSVIELAYLFFVSIIYSLVSWLSSIGLYEVGLKPLVRRGE